MVIRARRRFKNALGKITKEIVYIFIKTRFCFIKILTTSEEFIFL